MKSKKQYFGKKGKKELSEFERSSIEKYQKRFSRWQKMQIDLLTFCINLVFAFSLTVSGFIIDNRQKDPFNEQNFIYSYSLAKSLLFLLGLSILIGIVGLIFRINDFRLTKSIVKIRRRIFELKNDIKYEDDKPCEISTQIKMKDKFICLSSFMGKMTQFLFYIQLALFVIAIWIIVLKV